MFSRDAENSSQKIVFQNTNTPDESVAERVFPRWCRSGGWVGV